MQCRSKGLFVIRLINGHRDYVNLLGAFWLSTMLLGGLPSNALPVNELPVLQNIASGQVSISRNANIMNVNSGSNKAIVNYQSFNVGSQAKVNFNLPNSQSAILNRVNGGNPSQIFGQINSNGNVFLVNPSGILFGVGSQVNVGGLVASTLALTDNDFIGENYKFSQQGNNSSIVNKGNLNAQQIALLSSEIDNQGSIITNNSFLIAGREISLTTKDGVIVEGVVTKAVEDASNTLIKNSGRIASNNLKVQAEIENGFYELAINNSGIIEADSIVSNNGVIEIISNSGTVINSGIIASEKGSVVLTGNKTALVERSIIVAGEKILIGGDYQGEKIVLTDGSQVENSQRTFIGENTVIKAGHKGEVIVWADKDTRFYGSIETGNNGFVEVSGNEYLDFSGSVQTNGGTLLLDPTNITISTAANSGTMSGASPFEDVISGTSNLNVLVLNSALVNGNVIVTTASGLAQLGDIKVDASVNGANAISWNTANSLTLLADNDINIFGQINSIGSGDLNLNAQGGNINLSGSVISASSGDINFTATGGAANQINFAGVNSIVNQAGNINLHAKSDINSSSTQLFTSGGDVSVISQNGNLNLQRINTSSSPLTGNSGNAGNISLEALNGGITHSNLLANSFSNDGDAGRGGDISITSDNGINFVNSGGIPQVSAVSFGALTADGGGNINYMSNGNITLPNIYNSTLTFSPSGGIAKSSGAINIKSNSGSLNITGGMDSRTYSTSTSGLVENGGDITLTANGGTLTVAGAIDSTSLGNSSIGVGGNIAILAADDISLNSDINGINFSNTTSSYSNGNINIESLNGGLVLKAVNSNAFSNNSLTSNGGQISLIAGNGSINSLGISSSSIANGGTTNLPGNGGDIEIKALAGAVTVTGNLDSQSSTNAGFPLDGGDITISSLDNVAVTGSIITTTLGSTSGDAGNLNITSNAGTVQLKGISTNSIAFGGGIPPGQANGGNVNLSGFGSVEVGSIDARAWNLGNDGTGTNDGGNITIASLNDIININGIIDGGSYSRDYIGDGGDVTLTAKLDINVNGTVNGLPVPITKVDFNRTFDRGAINITSSEGDVSTLDLLSNSYTFDQGSFGTIFLNANNINVSAVNGSIKVGVLNSSSVAFTTDAGDAGSINLLAKDNIEYSPNGVKAFSFSQSLGTTSNGGEINIKSLNGSIGDGGNTISFNPSWVLPEPSFHAGSFISSSSISTTTSGDAGNITLDASSNGAIDIGSLFAISQSGTGGNISVAANLDLNSSNSSIQGKQINFEAGEINLSNSFINSLAGAIELNATEQALGNINLVSTTLDSGNQNSLLISNNNISLNNSSIQGQNIFLISDNINPVSPTFGNNGISMLNGSSLEANNRVLLYTSSPQNNSINASSSISGLNGGDIIDPNSLAVDQNGPFSLSQRWGVYYSTATDPASSGNGIISRSGDGSLVNLPFGANRSGIFYKVLPLASTITVPPVVNPPIISNNSREVPLERFSTIEQEFAVYNNPNSIDYEESYVMSFGKKLEGPITIIKFEGENFAQTDSLSEFLLKSEENSNFKFIIGESIDEPSIKEIQIISPSQIKPFPAGKIQ